MKKILLLMIILFLTSGCKVEYKLTIDDDLKIIEDINMTGTKHFFKIYYKSSKLNVVEMFLNDNKSSLDENGYNYEIIEEDVPYVIANKDYDDVESFVDKTIFYKQYFENLDYKNEDGIITISTNDFKPNDPENPERFDISDLTIAINSKYKVVSHNATSVNDRTNTYYWNINRNTTDFQLSFSIDSNTKFNPYIDMYIAIIVTTLIVVVTWVFIWYFYRKDKKNEKNKDKYFNL